MTMLEIPELELAARTVQWRLAKDPVFAISGESILLRKGRSKVSDDRILHPRTAEEGSPLAADDAVFAAAYPVTFPGSQAVTEHARTVVGAE